MGVTENKVTCSIKQQQSKFGTVSGRMLLTTLTFLENVRLYNACTYVPKANLLRIYHKSEEEKPCGDCQNSYIWKSKGREREERKGERREIM